MALRFSGPLPWRHWWLPALLLAIGLLPLALLSYYNHPFMDDYFNAANARRLGFWAGQRDLYLNWTGRFFSSLLLVGANPMHYDWYDGLRLTPFIVLSMSYAVAYLGVRTLSPASRPRVEAALLAGIVLLAYFQMIRRVYPALYWFTGSVVYQLAGLWVLLALIAGIRAGRATAPGRRRGWWALAAFSTVAAAGSNEMTLLHVLLGTSLMAVLHRHTRIGWLGLLVLASVAGAVTLTAPGNFARMTNEFAANPAQRSLLAALPEAVSGAFYSFLIFFGHARVMLWLGLMAFWAFIVLRWQRDVGLAITPRLPWYLGLACLLAGLYGTELLLTVAMGNRGWPDRVLNALWLYWLPASMLMVWAAIAANPVLRLRRMPQWPLPTVFTIAVIGLLLQPLPRRAWRELLLNASSYDRQLLAREEMLRGAEWRQQEHLVVPPVLGITPERVLITGWDLSTDPDFYVNYETALYFGVKTLRVDERLLPQAHPDFQNN